MMASIFDKWKYTRLGRRLRILRATAPEREHGELTSASLIELAGMDSGLSIPLKGLLLHPRLLVNNLKGDGSSATLLRDDIVSELEVRHAKEVVSSLCIFLNGYLGLEEVASPNSSLKSIASSRFNSSSHLRIGAFAKGEAKRLGDRVTRSVCGKSLARNSLKKEARLNSLGIATENILIAAAIILAFSTIAWRASLPCHLFNYCPEYMATQASKNDLAEAQKLLNSVKLASSLDELEAISGALQGHLASLRQQTLTNAQRQSLRQIESSSAEISKYVDYEKVNNSRISKATALVEAANLEQGKQREALMDDAKEIYDTIILGENSILIRDYTKLKQLLTGSPVTEKTVSAPAYPQPARSLPERQTPVTKPSVQPVRPPVPPPSPSCPSDMQWNGTTCVRKCAGGLSGAICSI